MTSKFTVGDDDPLLSIQAAYNAAAAHAKGNNAKAVFEKLRDTSAAAVAATRLGTEDAALAVLDYMSALEDVEHAANTDKEVETIYHDMMKAWSAGAKSNRYPEGP